MTDQEKWEIESREPQEAPEEIAPAAEEARAEEPVEDVPAAEVPAESIPVPESLQPAIPGMNYTAPADPPAAEPVEEIPAPEAVEPEIPAESAPAPEGWQPYTAPAGYSPEPGVEVLPPEGAPAAPQPPVYGAGQPGWGQTPPPWQGNWAPQPQPAPAKKKKMPTGLLVFLIIALSLSMLAVGGFGVYAVLNRSDAPVEEPIWDGDGEQNPFGNGDFPFGEGENPFGNNNPFGNWGRGEDDGRSEGSRPEKTPSQGNGSGDEEDEKPTPDFGVTPPEPDDPQPEIDTTPTGESIEIHQPGTKELTPEAVYEKVVVSTVTVASTLEKGSQVSSGVGTGIVATADGYIITNAHVVLNSKSTRVNIITSDGEEHAAVVVGVDKTTDLAVLKTDATGLTPAEFGDSDQLAIGQTVFAIGNPGGIKYTGSLTGGYISGLNREAGKYSENGMTYIQTDAAINPGNSGGPLVNLYGQVVGINSSKIVSANYESMSFAIPVTKAKAILDQLMDGGYVKGRVRIGISGFDVADTQYVMMGTPLGFVVSEINEESAFNGTDVQPGDIITAVDGVEVSNLQDISNQLLKYSPGDKVTMTLYRVDGGETFDVEITLLEDKGETQN